MTQLNTTKNSQSLISLKHVVSIAFLLLVAAIAFSVFNFIRLTSPNGLGLSNKMVSYESPSGQYSILVSPKWRIMDLPLEQYKRSDIRTIISSPYSSLTIFVAKKRFEMPVIDEVVYWGKTHLHKNYIGYKEIKTTEVTDIIHPSVLIEYSRNTSSPFFEKTFWDSETMRCLDYYFIEKEYGYSFSFCSVEKVWNNAENLFNIIIESIETK